MKISLATLASAMIALQATAIDIEAFDQETADAQLDDIHQCYADVEDAYKTIVFDCMGENFEECWSAHQEEY